MLVRLFRNKSRLLLDYYILRHHLLNHLFVVFSKFIQLLISARVDLPLHVLLPAIVILMQLLKPRLMLLHLILPAIIHIIVGLDHILLYFFIHSLFYPEDALLFFYGANGFLDVVFVFCLFWFGWNSQCLGDPISPWSVLLSNAVSELLQVRQRTQTSDLWLDRFVSIFH